MSQPPSGYVVVGFEEPYDFSCLVPETSLQLVDRALSAGDVVKRNLSDAISGTVISTTLQCTLRPLCSVEQYALKQSACPHGELSKSDIKALSSRGLGENERLEEQLAGIPAHELKYWNQYREDDYIIYQDWVGQILDVTDEVTIRLSNGSVVAVQNLDELEEPYWLPGTLSSELHRRLLQLDYELQHTRKRHRPGKSWPAEPCFPGQIVETKKGNLRRGSWKFGVYDPNVVPRGIVVEVRIVQIEVEWMYPNLFQSKRTQRSAPSIYLGVDVLQSGGVKVYDHSRQTQAADFGLQPKASFSPDIGFGHRVRFRDVAEAAVKYSAFKPTTRTATQGYDMNVLQVRCIRTEATIQWQDGTVTVEESSSLVPYENIDDYDVWPGTFVSLKSEEVDRKDTHVLSCKKVGVVQSSDAAERTATIRWFSTSVATIPHWDPSHYIAPTQFGPISDDIDEVSLYDVVQHPALSRSRGDLVIVVPYPLPPIDRVGTLRDAEFQEIVHETYRNLGENFSDSPDSRHVSQPRTRRNATVAPGHHMLTEDASTSASSDVDWFGEIIESRLDGKLTVRLGAADEVRDIELPHERTVLVAGDVDEDGSDEEDSDYDSNETWESDCVTDNDSDGTSEVILSWDVHYAGGQRLDNDTDEDMWSTEDDEMPDLIDISPQKSLRQSSSSDDHMPDLIPLSSPSGSERQRFGDEMMPDSEDVRKPFVTSLDHTKDATSSPIPHTQAVEPIFDTPVSNDMPTAPPRFAILQENPPGDHYYHSKATSLSGAKMRRIIREHQIMQSSLPEGVYVRTWEDRLDLLRVFIIGPQETPYELAPFLFDFYFGDDFPTRAPEAYFHSWTSGVGRVNPNLYEDGTICLSLLGTWPGDNEKDTWSAKDSTMLQLIVSILGLVLVKEPYYNEAGFEVLAGTSESATSSAQYSERAFILSRGFVQGLLEERPAGVHNVTEWAYLSKDGPQLLTTVIKQAKALLLADPNKSVTASVGFGNGGKRLSRGAAIPLERTVKWLEEYVAAKLLHNS